ncbi:Serine-rich protein [Madurella fahalii]|uniref:Serine-rich protein n=1 Tax=Madurella fahalii TaxID=1157608 RepID=A0ABQ0GS61_9PEZI
MSAPPARHGPTTPLHERSNSQNNSRLGIRIVPYTPPRIDPENRAPSQTSSRDNADSRRCSANYNDQATSNAGHGRRASWRGEVAEESAGAPGSALSSPTASGFSLARSRDERVSGVKPVAGPSGVGPARPTVPHLRSSSEVSTSIAAFNASALQLSRSDDSPSPASATSQPRRPLPRRKTFVAVHSDKTFSLVRHVPESDVSGSLTGSTRSPPLSYASRTPSAQERPSTDAWSDGQSTPLTGASTTILDQSFSELLPSSPSSRASSSTHLAEDPIASSPWNYRLVGGLRKVPKTPDLKQKQPLYNTTAPSAETLLAPLPEATAPQDEEETPTRTVVPKASFTSVASEQTLDTVSEATNYKVYGPPSAAQESSDSLFFNPAGPSNWEILDRSSPAPFPSSPPTIPTGSNENYVLHGAPSLSPSSSLVTVSHKPLPAYSQESLIVAPLRPAKRRSHERFGYYKQRSRETLRSRTGSVQSLRSIPSIIAGQDPAQALLSAAPALINLGTSSARAARGGDSGSTSQYFPWLNQQAPESSSSAPQKAITQRPPAQMIQAAPHQWSSQLSTVMSESEGGSEGDPTRSVSPLSEGSGHRRRSSLGWVSSLHSRQIHSISSSIVGQLEEAAATSASDSLDRPQPSYARAGPSQIRMVRDQDEHGDGLADLDHRPSKTGLSALFLSSNPSSRNLHSSGSSRANSFTSSIPAWAMVYYGSGERRWLGRSPSFLTSSSDAGDSRPPSSAFRGSESPNTDHFPQSIFSPRKRARDVQPTTGQRRAPDQASMEITPAQPAQDYRVIRSLKPQTSSIWSPHLQMDRRASRYSVWDPPSVSWSADSGILGKRNAQVVLFILGFILPLAWMVAALLPLPPNPKLQMFERDNISGHPAFQYHQQLVEETRFESARWWRNLNRVMSVVGLLIIGAVIALAVVGVQQGWTVHS